MQNYSWSRRYYCGSYQKKSFPVYPLKSDKVSRNPKKLILLMKLFRLIFTIRPNRKAIAGSDIVYLFVGLKYDTKPGKNNGPKVMRNTIDACKK